MSLMNDNLTAQLLQNRQSEGSLKTVEKNYWVDSETFMKLREQHQCLIHNEDQSHEQLK